MSGTDLVPHFFEGHRVRSSGTHEDPWFVAADICAALGLKNVAMAVKILDGDEKGISTVDTHGGQQDLIIISEPGMYKLVGRSRKPDAKRFDRWVRHVVLPKIRKTGAFGEDHAKIATLQQSIDTLTDRVNTLMLASDARVAALDLISVRQLLDEAGALSKKRRSLNGRVHHALTDLALKGDVKGCRRCPHSNKWLFPIEFARAWFKETGALWVAEHNDKVKGQGVLQFPRRKAAPAPQPGSAA